MPVKRIFGLSAALLAGFWLIAAGSPSLAQNLVEGTHYWLEPATSGTAQRGPEQAKGAVIWNDGYSPERNASDAVPPIVRFFAGAGWDAFNLGRHSGFTAQRISPLILLAIDRMKAKGYRRIVLVGHSAGAFASIEAGGYRPDVTGILALAPASQGDFGRSTTWRQNDGILRNLWESYKDSPVRVAAGFFSGDDWYETKHPHVRGPYAARRLGELGVAHFIIDQPGYPGMDTHYGGTGMEFARRFGPCLERFFDTGERPPCDDGDPRAPDLFGISPPPIPSKGDDSFAGQWQGTTATGRFVVLTIPPPERGRRAAIYRTGRGVDDDRPETRHWALTARDGMLVREGKFELRLRLEGDRLKITYADYAEIGDEKPFAVLTRPAAR